MKCHTRRPYRRSRCIQSKRPDELLLDLAEHSPLSVHMLSNTYFPFASALLSLPLA